MTQAVDIASSTAHRARVRLLDRLQASGYEFVSPAPATHRRVSERRDEARPGDLRDIFGWGRRFHPEELDVKLLGEMREADALSLDGDWARSSLRVSRLDGRLHLHSARGDTPNAVFLGPDSHRFVRFLDRILPTGASPARVLDIGTGAGAGALAVAVRADNAEVIATDINPAALALTAANAAHAGIDVSTVLGSGPSAAEGRFDLIITNPPFIAGSNGRVYRDGGGQLGGELLMSWLENGLPQLAPGGRFALYTGSPVVEGRHLLRRGIEQLSQAHGLSLVWEELDPDIFGNLLRTDAYAEVERIAAVGVTLHL